MQSDHSLLKLRGADVESVKNMIAEVVLEFYSDLDFLPKTKLELLLYYQKISYLSDLDAHETEYADENGLFLVMKDSNGIQGCGGLRRLTMTDGELVRVWLRKEYRGRGYGQDILNNLMLVANKIGYQKIFLDTSHRNKAAIELFRKNGFTDCLKYKESIEDVFMCKDFVFGI